MILALILIAAFSVSCDRQLSKYDRVRLTTEFDYNAGVDLSIDAGERLVTNVEVEHQVVYEGKMSSSLWEQLGGAGEVEFSDPRSPSLKIKASADGTYTLRFTAYSVRNVAVTDELTFVWDTTPPESPVELGASSTTPDVEMSAYVNSTTPYLDWSDAVDLGSGVRDYDLLWYRAADCQGEENKVTALTSSHYQVSGAEGDVFSYRVTSYDKLGQARVSECSPDITIDLTPPPALAAASGSTGTTVGMVDLSVTYPGDTSDYGRVVMRRLAGATAPSGCTAGTAGAQTVGPSFSGVETLKDDTSAPGGVFSYLACVYDRAGNVTASHTINNKIAKPHQIFATSTTVDGSIAGGGLAQAEALCQTAAGSVPALTVHKQEAKWKAILSTTAIDAATRIVINGSVEANGVVVAASRAAFWGGALANSVFQDETSAAAPAFAWTGSNADGSLAANHCNDWSSASAGVSGRQGDTNASTTSWLSASDAACNASKSIYCISQYAVAAPIIAAQTASSGSGKINITITLPASRSRYSSVKLQRLAGDAAPNYACTNGTTLLTKTLSATDTVVSYADEAAMPGGATYSYRVCVLDDAGYVVEGASATAVVSSNF